MQPKTNVIHSITLSPKLTIIFTEGNDCIKKRDFLIQAQEGTSIEPKLYKSLFYIEDFEIYTKREIIKKWIDGNISNEDLKLSTS